MTVNDYMNKIIDIEIKNNLYDIKYKGFPIYRILRYFIRPELIRSFDGSFSADSRHVKPSIKTVIKNVLFSCFDLCRLFLSNKKIDVAFFPSFRLQKMGDLYIDKLTDPIILRSDLCEKDKYVIFSSSFYNCYRKERVNYKMVRQVESIFFLSFIIAHIIYPFFKFAKKGKEIDLLLFKVQKMFAEKKDFRKQSYVEFIMFVIQYKLFSLLFNRIGCKKIFLVIRGNYYPQILAAHRNGIKVYEIQHGVTYGGTVLYSGSYDNIADPDCFLVFGSMWIGPQFGMPIEKIENIGFAYKDLVQKVVSNKIEDSILIISSPDITELMVKVTIKLAQTHKNKKFFFRPHPHEGLSELQIKSLLEQDNISFSDKSVDSNIEVMKYSKVIGTNSSVLFEANSIGIDVGRLTFGGLTIERYPGDDVFFYINSLDDFDDFLDKSKNRYTYMESYSDFNKEKFLSIYNS